MFNPENTSRFITDENYRLDLQKLSLWLGWTALAIPIVMYVGRRFGDCEFDSISHYYYSRYLGGFFVIALSFVGSFLIAYRGAEFWENWFANAAGIGAFMVAFFPTRTNGGCDECTFTGRTFVKPVSSTGPEGVKITYELDFQLFKHADWLHYGGAAVVFLTLCVFCFFVFTRVDEHHRDKAGDVLVSKQRRNRFYRWCGSVILACIVLLGGEGLVKNVLDWELPWWDRLNLTFWLESVALVAFGFAWLVRGRFLPWFDEPAG